MKIYFSKYFDDYIFVIGGQPYLYIKHTYSTDEWVEIGTYHLKNSRMHKRKEDKEVIFICTIRD